MSIDLTPPSGAAYEARRALRMLEWHNSTGISMALAVARDIEAGSELPESTVRRMKDFFTTHAEESRSADFFSDEKPSSNRVRWGLYGGDSGHAWAEKVVRTLDASDASEGRAIAAEKARLTEGDGVERRFCGSFDSTETASDEALSVEERADSTGGKKTYIVGYAAKFGFDSVLLGDFVERIAPTAFDILKTGKDGDGKKIATRGLFNHDPNFLLGRYPDTMSLEVDEKGLRYEILLPESQRAISEAILRKDLRGSSFSFVVAPGGEKWSYENGQSIRTVTKVKAIVDCGPVTFPAYDSSSCAIAMRSFDQYTVQRRAEDCGREPDGKFGSGNKCAGASDIEGSRLVEGALNGSVLGGAIGGVAAGAYGFGIGAATGAVVGAVAHGLLYESSHQEASLKEAYEKTGTSTEKFDKAAKTLGVTLHIASYTTEKNGPAVVASASRGDFKLTVEGTSAKPAGPLSMSVRGVRTDSGIPPAKAASLLVRAAKQLGASTIIVDAHDDPAMRKGLVANGFTDRDGILTRRIGSLKATKRSIEEFLAERRAEDCGREPDGKFGSGNKCAGASDSEGPGVVAAMKTGAALGSILGVAHGGSAIAGAVRGAMWGAVVHAFGYDKQEAKVQLQSSFHVTGTSEQKFDDAAKTLGVRLEISPDNGKQPGVKAQTADGKFRISAKGSPANMHVEGVTSKSGVPGNKVASLLSKAAKQLTAKSITVDTKGDKEMADALSKHGFSKDKDGFMRRSLDSVKATKRSIEAFLAERRGDCGRDSDGKFGSGNSCAGGGSGKSAEKQMKDDNFHATYGVKLKQEFDKDKAIGEKAKAKLRGAVESQNKPHEASTSTWELPDAETPAEKEASGKPPVVSYKAQLAAKSAARLAANAPKKSLTWEKGDNKSPEKTAAAQKFIEDAHNDHMKLGGKSGGKADDGGGVQTWSKGDHFPWTMKQVGSDSGHVQAQHPDGSVTSKHTFEGGNVGPAISKLKAELLATKPKKSQRHEMLVAFLEKRTK